MELLKKLVPHVLVGTGIVIAFFYGTLGILGSYTHHDKTLTVPNFVGMDCSDVNSALITDLEVVINDSIYVADQPPGVILRQFPEHEDVVKSGRTVYLQMNNVRPESTRVPRLLDMSPRQARHTLAALGFDEGEPLVVKDTFAVVLGVRCDGRFVNSGDRVNKGCSLQLVVGDGRPRF